MKILRQLLMEKETIKNKKSIKMTNNQRSDTEKINLIEEGKKIAIDGVIRHNKIINNTLKFKL